MRVWVFSQPASYTGYTLTPSAMQLRALPPFLHYSTCTYTIVSTPRALIHLHSFICRLTRYTELGVDLQDQLSRYYQ